MSLAASEQAEPPCPRGARGRKVAKSTQHKQSRPHAKAGPRPREGAEAWPAEVALRRCHLGRVQEEGWDSASYTDE